MFLVVQNIDFATYAYGNNTDGSIDVVKFFLQEPSKSLFKWLTDNQMKSNIDKYFLILARMRLPKLKKEIFQLKVAVMKLDDNIYSKVNFDSHETIYVVKQEKN